MGFLNWAVMIAPTFAALWNPRHPNHEHITGVFDRLWKPVVLPPMAGGSGQGRQFQAARFQETLTLHAAPHALAADLARSVFDIHLFDPNDVAHNLSPVVVATSKTSLKHILASMLHDVSSSPGDDGNLIFDNHENVNGEIHDSFLRFWPDGLVLVAAPNRVAEKVMDDMGFERITQVASMYIQSPIPIVMSLQLWSCGPGGKAYVGGSVIPTPKNGWADTSRGKGVLFL